MATYATQVDFTNYVEGWVTTDSDALEALLQRAEKDIDRIVIPVLNKTDEIHGIAISGVTPNTLGQFQLAFIWNRITFTSAPITPNIDGDNFIAALQGATDTYGNPVPPMAGGGASSYPAGIVAGIDNSQYYDPWAYGPLPAVPIVFEWENLFGNQQIPIPTVVNNTLSDPHSTPTVTLSEIVKGGLKINPYLLSGLDSARLRDATCAQAEYRNEMGEAFFRRAQWASVSGPDFKTTGRLPLIGPKVKQELSGSDLLQRGARALPGSIRGRQIVYTPVGGTPIPDDWRPI
jgi:hypothetical protein